MGTAYIAVTQASGIGRCLPQQFPALPAVLHCATSFIREFFPTFTKFNRTNNKKELLFKKYMLE
jgi:hypothetical protein